MKLIIEIANVHEGDAKYLSKLVRKINHSKVQYIKHQLLVPSEFGYPNSDAFKEFDRLKIPLNDFEEVMKDNKRLNYMFDVFGKESLKEAIYLKKTYPSIVKAVKFHTTNALNLNLIDQALNFFDNIFTRT